MSEKTFFLINIILVIVATVAWAYLCVIEFMAGMYWFAILYMTLTGADGFLTYYSLKQYIEFKNLEKITK